MGNSGTGSEVVARLLDGRVLKGTTHDFAPHKAVFHMTAWDDPTARATAVPIGAMKALFFVRTYEGDPTHIEDRDLVNAK